MCSPSTFSPARRGLLRAGAATLAASPFVRALATTAGDDYKALVCVYLHGGNDAYNTVLATDTASWYAYHRARAPAGSTSIALAAPGTSPVAGAARGSPAALGGVLPIALQTPQAGRTFALNPLLTRVRSLYGNRRIAVVSNVGTLREPTTVAGFKAATNKLPPKLFSHNDQQMVWQSFEPTGATVGWGGRMAEMMAAGNGSAGAFTAVSPNGHALWLNGPTLAPCQISVDGAVRFDNATSPLFDSMSAWAQLRGVVASDTETGTLERAYADIGRRSMERGALLGNALPVLPAATRYTSPNTGLATDNPLAQQLQAVARMIAARQTLGLKRQVFFVGLGGFDTHNGQNAGHAELMARLDHALGGFHDTLATLPSGDATGLVTTFTASDFGRSLVSNGDGTDHGWGGHHFVMGAAVRGGDLYGRFPAVGLDTESDVGSGRLLPSLSVDQYGATLARWFGVPDAQLGALFPNLASFGTRDLGFMA